ncbi:MAG: hypothetical protein RSF00_08195 [Oscillospiraceae bacterium]
MNMYKLMCGTIIVHMANVRYMVLQRLWNTVVLHKSTLARRRDSARNEQ